MFDDFPVSWLPSVPLTIFNIMLDVPFETSRGLEQSRPSRVADEPVSQENGLWRFVTFFYLLFDVVCGWTTLISHQQETLNYISQRVNSMLGHATTSSEWQAWNSRWYFFNKPCHWVILPLCSLKPWVVAIEGPRRIAADAAVFYCHERKGMQVDFFWGSSDTLIVVLP